MAELNRKAPNRTLLHIRANWPRFAILYGTIVVALFFIGISAFQEWYGFIPMTLALILILVYFLFMAFWSTQRLYGPYGIRPYHQLFDMGNIRSRSEFIYIDLGLRYQPLSLSRRLTTGKITVVDVYNPQWNSSRALVRWRAQMPHPPNDPRVVWLDGDIHLLPIPDASVETVVLCQILSEYWQKGDRTTLLNEVHRILKPGGQLLFAEQVRTQANWLTLGPAALQLPSINYWHQLVSESGFGIQKQQVIQGLVYCAKATKLTPSEVRQLSFQLEY